MVTKQKPKANLQVTGRTVAYIQSVSKNGKLGKAKPFVVTTVRAGSPAPVAKKATRRRRKK